jgi:hypothetical protein
VHNLLRAAEQALAAGQLQAARAAADEIRSRKMGAGALPKPTVQRLSRLTQQLTELERWESFGQHQARLQLCERAEAAATLASDPPRLALEVRNLRNEWKALDEQHAGVPKALWERFDHACEKAYAPAARHFAEQAAARKQARKQREDFITAAAACATLLVEPLTGARRALAARTEQRWREGDMGSVEPKAWKGLDARLRAALAPLRDALFAARAEAKARRLALIEEATALAAKAMERDAPAQVKAVQVKWQAQAKDLALGQRDERALWEQFRIACDAVFQAREAKRKEEDDRKHEGRRALEDVCVQLEQLARATDKEDQELRRALRELQEQWRQKSRASAAPALRGLESRFATATSAVEAAMTARARGREAAVWQTLAAGNTVRDAGQPAALARRLRQTPRPRRPRSGPRCRRSRSLGEGHAGQARRSVACVRRRARRFRLPCADRGRGASAVGNAARARNAARPRMSAGAPGAASRAAGATPARSVPERGGGERAVRRRALARMVRAAGRGRRSRSAALRTDLCSDGTHALSGSMPGPRRGHLTPDAAA